jgi:molecular chaperone HscA
MDIHVLQGERDLVADCRSLARFQVKGIPASAAGQARVRVSFQIDADGILRVSAHELSTDTHQEIEVRPTHGLDDDAIENMLQAALDNAEGDVMTRQLRTAQVEAERTLLALKRAMDTDGDLLEGDEHVDISSAIADLEAAIQGTDHGAIQDLTELLDRLSAGLAQRRMDRALNEGLKNVQISKLEADVSSSNRESDD